VAKRLDLPFDPIARAAQIWEEKFGPADAMAAVTSIMRAQQLLLGERSEVGALDGHHQLELGLLLVRAGRLAARLGGSRASPGLAEVVDELRARDSEVEEVVRLRAPRRLRLLRGNGPGTRSEIAGRALVAGRGVDLR